MLESSGSSCSCPDYADIRINQVKPDRGAWPPPEHKILIERAGLERLSPDCARDSSL